MHQAFRETKPEITFFSTRCLDFPSHIHEDVEVVYIKKSGGTAYCDGKAYPLKEGTFFLTFPNQVHHYTDSASGDYILLIVKPNTLLNRNDLFFKGTPTSAYCDCADPDTVELLEIALREYEQNGENSAVDACLMAFFEKLITFYTIEKGAASADTVMRLLQYCNEHYREDITVDDLAAALHISRSSVSHIFSDRLGIGFCDHIHALRLIDAMRLLRDKHYSITEVSEIAGFPTIRTFNRVFQRQYGMSPSAYRKQI